VDPARGRALRAVLADHPDALVLEDDYVARVAGAPYVPVHRSDGRWAVVRSFSKVLGPDLRLAVVAGDPLTIARVEGRQRLGPGWVSHILQQLGELLLRERSTASLLARAERGIEALGDSGLGVWVPLTDEAAAVRELLVQGWAVSPGERYRFRSAPGIRPHHDRRPRAERGSAARGCDRGARQRAGRDVRRLTSPYRLVRSSVLIACN
jgi:hypothetical protein